MFDSQVIVAVIAASGGILSSYIAVWYRNRKFKIRGQDRMETIFDGYEALIKQQQIELNRKGQLIDQLESQLDKMQVLVSQLRDDLERSRVNADTLGTQLDSMKISYRRTKPKEA